jgi:hypothetical protein
VESVGRAGRPGAVARDIKVGILGRLGAAGRSPKFGTGGSADGCRILGNSGRVSGSWVSGIERGRGETNNTSLSKGYRL